jgi:AraC-like DNA-binding protein
METVVLVLCWLGVFHSSLLGLYFLTTKSSNSSHVFLGATLVFISIRVAKSTLFIFTDHHSEFLFNVGFAAHAAIGPAMFFYLRSLKSGWTFSRFDFLHFIPAIVILLAAPLLTLGNFWYKGGYGILLYYSLFYCILFGSDLYKNVKSKKLLNGISSSWITLLTAIITLFLSAYFSNYILGITSYITAPVISAGGLYVITFAVLKNNGVFLAEIKEKYQNLKLTGEDLKVFRNKIVHVMESKRPFLDNNFSLTKLSEMTSIPQHMLSRTFSMEFQENFTNFINRYRVEESKRILRDPSKHYLSIAGIAFESGFNSISSFNVSFKKNMGITPSEFKKGSDETLSALESI